MSTAVFEFESMTDLGEATNAYKDTVRKLQQDLERARRETDKLRAISQPVKAREAEAKAIDLAEQVQDCHERWSEYNRSLRVSEFEARDTLLSSAKYELSELDAETVEAWNRFIGLLSRRMAAAEALSVLQNRLAATSKKYNLTPTLAPTAVRIFGVEIKAGASKTRDRAALQVWTKRALELGNGQLMTEG